MTKIKPGDLVIAKLRSIDGIPSSIPDYVYLVISARRTRRRGRYNATLLTARNLEYPRRQGPPVDFGSTAVQDSELRPEDWMIVG